MRVVVKFIITFEEIVHLHDLEEIAAVNSNATRRLIITDDNDN